MLVQNGFRAPHAVLTNFVFLMTGFRPNDGDKFIESDNIVTQAPPYTFDFSKLEKSDVLFLVSAKIC
jgi:hypothetical protein